MDKKVERLLRLTDRVLSNIENQVPPERVATDELRILVDELIGRTGKTPTPSAPGR